MSARPAYQGAHYPWHRVRSALYDALYVSPHMDDAVYSCGGQIALQRASGMRVLVVTLFGNGSTEEQGRGVFGDIAQRKREEQAAMARLDVDHVWLNYPDLLVREKSLGELARYVVPFAALAPSEIGARIHAALHVLCSRLLSPGGRVYFPFAIGFHPDHRLTFQVGRALGSSTALALSFYEDVPYAQVEALRAERLHYLGIAVARGAALRDARAVHDFSFAHVPRWQRPFTQVAVLGHLLGSRALHRVLGSRDDWGRALLLEERVIDEVLALKVAAMRDYRTQTDYFYPPEQPIESLLCRAGAHYVERYWTPRTMTDQPAQPAQASYVLEENRKLEALLGTLAS